MPIQKRIATKPAATKTPAAATPAQPDNDTEVTAVAAGTVSVYRGMTVQIGDGQFAKIGVTVNDVDYEAASEKLDEYVASEFAKALAQVQEFAFASSDNGEGETAGEAEGGEEGAEDADIGPDQIREMDRAALVQLIKENEIDLKPEDYKKTAAGLDEMREAIIAVAFPEGEEAEGEEEGAEGEGAEEGEEAGDGDGADISVEDIMAMDRPTLVKLIKDNEIPVDPKTLPKLSELKTAVIEALSGEEGEEAGDGEEAGGEEEVTTYTRDDLNKMSVADLKAIYADWDLGNFPAGPPPVAKKNAVTAIIKAQNG